MDAKSETTNLVFCLVVRVLVIVEQPFASFAARLECALASRKSQLYAQPRACVGLQHRQQHLCEQHTHTLLLVFSSRLAGPNEVEK